VINRISDCRTQVITDVMGDFFVKIFQYFQRRPLFLWTTFLLITGFCIYSASDLRFVEDIGSFLPSDEDNKKINFAYQHLSDGNTIVVNVKMTESDNVNVKVDRELLKEAAAQFAEYLSDQDTLHRIQHITYEIDQRQMLQVSDFLVKNMAYFLSDEDYLRIDSLLTPENITYHLQNNKQLLLSPMGIFIRSALVADPLHFSNGILQGLSAFRLNDQYHLEDGFIFNGEGTETLVTITSKYPVSETANNKLLANDIANAVRHTKSHFDEQIDLIPFGAALISIANADQIKKDSYAAIALALIFILALLIYFFRNTRSIILIAVSVAFGMLFALGMIVLVKDTVSIIAIGIASVIIGIAINYPLHFLAHYKHGHDKKQTIKEIVNPLLIGNITTVGAFLSLLFISSDAMKDLGLFASLLLIGTILFVLFFLPHFLKKKPKKDLEQEKRLAFGRLASFAPEKNKWIVLSVLTLTVVFLFFSFRTSFETNLHAINYMTQEQRVQFDKLIQENKSNYKTLYFIARGDNLDHALESYETGMFYSDSLFHAGLIARQSGILHYLPSEKMQRQKIERWNGFWKNRKDQLIENIDKIAVQEGYHDGSFDIFKSILNRKYQPESHDYFDVILSNLGENYLAVTPDRSLVFTVLQLDPENQSQVEETLNAIDEALFTFDNVSVADRMVNALSGDFNYVFFICGFIVFFFLLFSFGRIELALASFIPLTVAWIWILGLMAIFGFKFNIVNIILATFIFGQGDDYTIFVTEGLIYEYTYRKKMLASFKNSVILSAIIMFLGIGMLIFAQHPAMRSLAEVTMVGMISVIFMAFIFPPLIFRMLSVKKGKPRLIPVTLWNLFKTIISFIIFIIGAIILTFVGFFLLTLGGKTKKHKSQYHVILYATFRILSKMMIQTPHKIVNPYNERFEKPSVILCNHQSHIDLLYTLMLSPKLIVLTNKWVWKSPFYGWIIRYADFLPAIDGIERHVDALEKLIADGYSILIFPEGTRSPDCSIQRFHKGAFYLAEKLNLDIVPLVIHGIGHVLPKTEFLLRKGQIHIEILERITTESPLRKGKKMLEISKNLRLLYVKKYNELASQIETPDYFKDKVYHNYIYKGPSIERKAKANLKKFNNFNSIISHIPDKGTLMAYHCGQGEFPLMCALVKKNLQITAFEEDEEAFAIAENCISKPKNLFYERKFENLEKYDTFVAFYPSHECLHATLSFNKPILLITEPDFITDNLDVKKLEENNNYTFYIING
jgi:1-acyl-sn-glycerol-3-phosphate acyltransferase